MIRDKNIFECIILNNQIWLPNYVCWGPPSMGHHRRSILFKRNIIPTNTIAIKNNFINNPIILLL